MKYKISCAIFIQYTQSCYSILHSLSVNDNAMNTCCVFLFKFAVVSRVCGGGTFSSLLYDLYFCLTCMSSIFISMNKRIFYFTLSYNTFLFLLVCLSRHFHFQDQMSMYFMEIIENIYDIKKNAEASVSFSSSSRL